MELTINDLRVGDYVMIAEFPMKSEIGQIQPVHFIRSLLKFEGIPLTGEILEKNGFKNFENMYYIYQLDDGIWLEYYPHEHRLTRICETVDEWQNHSKVRDITFKCQCYYVHELQSALKLCYAPIQIKL